MFTQNELNLLDDIKEWLGKNKIPCNQNGIANIIAHGKTEYGQEYILYFNYDDGNSFSFYHSSFLVLYQSVDGKTF